MNARRTLGILGILMLTLLVGTMGPSTAGAADFILKNLTQSPEMDSQLAVAEGAAVWVSGVETDAEIWLYDFSEDPESLPMNISNNEYEDTDPQVEEDQVIWETQEDYRRLLNGCPVDNPEEPMEPIELYDESEALLTDGEWAVWVGSIEEGDGEGEGGGPPVVWYANLAEGGDPQVLEVSEEFEEMYPLINPDSIRITDGKLAMEFVEVDGEHEVQQTRLCYADLRTEEVLLKRFDPDPVPEERYDERNPSFERERLTWIRDYEEGEETEIRRAIFEEVDPEPIGDPVPVEGEAFDPLTDEEGRLIWVGLDPYEGDTDIYYCDISSPEEVYNLSNNDFNDMDPMMTDGLLVWRSEELTAEEFCEVYFFDLNEGPLAIPALVTDRAARESPWITERRIFFIGYDEEGNLDIFMARQSEICAYTFTCYYNNGAGDYYSGIFYASEELGEDEIVLDFVDENGQHGYYEITGILEADPNAEDGQVFVDTYYDRESNFTYTPLHAGDVIGEESLGSERDYLLLNGYVLNRFGIGPEGAEEVHYEADVTRAQDVYNRHREPFRTIRLRSLHRCYILQGTRHPELFDDAV